MSSSPVARPLNTWQQRAAEHARRMEADPVYRAEVEAEERERAASEAEEKAKLADQIARADAEGRRTRADVPKRVWPFLDAPEKTAAYAAACEFALASSETLLVLAGGIGCGKTVGACAALDAFLVEGRRKTYRDGFRPLGVRDPSGKVVKAIEMARAGTFDREFWDGLAGLDFLVIDDLGTEPLDDKGWLVANIRAVIDRRYDDERKTVLTTNLNLDQFKARYCADGGRLLDRLKERGAFIEIADGSLRRAGV